MSVCRENWWNNTDIKKLKCSKKKPVPLLLYPIQIPRGLLLHIRNVPFNGFKIIQD
jgi:hypothetical protein